MAPTLVMQPEPTSEEIYYTSTYRHGVDEKRRIQIPAKWRSEKPQVLTMVLWPKGTMTEACVLVFPPAEWAALVQKVKSKDLHEMKVQALRNLLGRRSDRVVPDRAGRICLPEAMAKAAAIENEAMLVGMLDHFAIWNPDRYAASSVVDDQMLFEAFQLI